MGDENAELSPRVAGLEGPMEDESEQLVASMEDENKELFERVARLEASIAELRTVVDKLHDKLDTGTRVQDSIAQLTERVEVACGLLAVLSDKLNTLTEKVDDFLQTDNVARSTGAENSLHDDDGSWTANGEKGSSHKSSPSKGQAGSGKGSYSKGQHARFRADGKCAVCKKTRVDTSKCFECDNWVCRTDTFWCAAKHCTYKVCRICQDMRKLIQHSTKGGRSMFCETHIFI